MGGPYICPIYRRDFLGFLDHAKLQECRLISRSYNYTILECPKLLPARQKFQGFHVNADIPASYRKDGHVDGRKMRNVVRWGAVQKKIGVCCSDLKKEAKKLDGQLVLLNRDENDCVFFDVRTLNKRVVCFGARNRLTTATAFSLLHFLEHLRNSAFHIMTIGAGVMDGFDDGAFNSGIFSALALPREPFKMVCKWARPSYHNHDAFRLPLVKSIRQFIKPVSLFCYVSEKDKPAALQLIANGRVHINKMVCRSLDPISEHLVS